MRQLFYAHFMNIFVSFLEGLELRHFFVRNAKMVSGLCYLYLQEFSFLNIQTLHNDLSYIEHVPLLFVQI